MRFKITRQQFLSQLPDTERVLLQKYPLQDHYYFNGMPEELNMNGEECGTLVHKDARVIAKKYPNVLAALPAMEFQMFCELISSEDCTATINRLSLYVKNPGIFNQNLIAVHVKSMRNCFREKGINMKIEIQRRTALNTNAYKLTHI